MLSLLSLLLASGSVLRIDTVMNFFLKFLFLWNFLWIKCVHFSNFQVRWSPNNYPITGKNNRFLPCLTLSLCISFSLLSLCNTWENSTTLCDPDSVSSNEYRQLLYIQEFLKLVYEIHHPLSKTHKVREESTVNSSLLRFIREFICYWYS